jgi:HEPN domain-containing protein
MANPDEILEWLGKAEDDHLAAQIILQSNHNISFPVVFHLQQMIEKLLKCLIINNNRQFEKTHDLSRLADLAAFPLNADQLDLCEMLTIFAVQTRYPGNIPQISINQAGKLFEEAAELRATILNRINPSPQ